MIEIDKSPPHCREIISVTCILVAKSNAKFQLFIFNLKFEVIKAYPNRTLMYTKILVYYIKFFQLVDIRHNTTLQIGMPHRC